jgi:hypothetical protein
MSATVSDPINYQNYQQFDRDGFDFSREIEEINRNDSIDLKDKALAKRLKKRINPNNIPDGHCASCAFNTHLHFTGHAIKEAYPPNDYKKFGDWFYLKYSTRFEEVLLEPEEDETFGQFKKRVKQKVLELTRPDEAVLISVSDGSHWFNAYNDGEKVWFVDSQSGKDFNLHESRKRQKYEPIKASQAVINIITVSPEDIRDYRSKFPV